MTDIFLLTLLSALVVYGLWTATYRNDIKNKKYFLYSTQKLLKEKLPLWLANPLIGCIYKMSITYSTVTYIIYFFITHQSKLSLLWIFIMIPATVTIVKILDNFLSLSKVNKDEKHSTKPR